MIRKMEQQIPQIAEMNWAVITQKSAIIERVVRLNFLLKPMWK